MKYQSFAWADSTEMSGVRLRVRCMSFGRRMALMDRVGEKLSRLEFLQAGASTPETDAEATALGAAIDREFLVWGLDAVEGLEIDGQAATPESLIESGPESLVHEALQVVRSNAGLSETERKNFESPSTLPTAVRPGGSATSAAV